VSSEGRATSRLLTADGRPKAPFIRRIGPVVCEDCHPPGRTRSSYWGRSWPLAGPDGWKVRVILGAADIEIARTQPSRR